MPLSLVLGPANAAKAGEVLGAYAAAASRDALLVVPTAADVAHYARELAAPGVTLGYALTFPGMIDEIAQRAGYRRTRLTALQRDRVLRRVIESLHLETLAASAMGPGFARAAGRFVSELRQARVDPARLTLALQTWAGGSRERIGFTRDLAAIYRRYVDELEQLDRVDAETFAWGALDALRSFPRSWGGTPVFLYGFDDLTPIELDTVETLARQADADVTVSLTYEPGRPALVARATVVEELRAFAESVTALPALDEHYSAAARAPLHHLERHLFEPGAPEIEPDEAVTLMEGGSERMEAELVAAEVLEALRAGVSPQEIVVVCRSLTRSAELLERALERAGVTATSARRVPLRHTALGRALLALTRYALLPGSQREVDDLIAYLRHPGVVESPDAVDRFERQVRVDGGRVGDALRMRGPEMRSAFAALERLRIAPDRIAAVVECARALLSAPHRAAARVLEASEQLDARAAAVVFDALEQLEQIEQGRTPVAAELIELLEGLLVPAHGAPPEGAVLVAEPTAIRARRFRRVLITGLCEGEFPSPQALAADPFLGDDRRRELAIASGLALPLPGDPLDRERYLLYACVSRATERVTFSYRSSDEDGNIVLASPFLDDIAALFPADWPGRRNRRLLADVVWSVEQAPTERERALAQAFAASAAGVSAAGGVGGAADASPETRVLGAQALSHVRHREVVSAGALELFAGCPVRWLVERQLEPERLEPDPAPVTRGSFIHTVLERVFARLDAPLMPGTLGTAEKLLGEEMRGSATAEDRAKLALDQANEVRSAILRGIEAELRRYLRHEAADGCEWPPLVTELRFGLDGDAEDAMPPVQLSDGQETVLLSGIIDRVDVDPGDRSRVIVRDYKSGAKRDTWPAARWAGDRQLQVALYMIAVQRLLGVRAVAGFYQPLAGDDLRPRGAHTAAVDVGVNVVMRDELADAELQQLLDQIEREAAGLAATLRRGELTPCPERCSPDGTCVHPGICWAAR